MIAAILAESPTQDFQSVWHVLPFHMVPGFGLIELLQSSPAEA